MSALNDTDLRQRAWNAASQVVDPEIPVLTIADLGVLREVAVNDGQVEVAITPTYSGCPAMRVIEDDIAAVDPSESSESFLQRPVVRRGSVPPSPREATNPVDLPCGLGQSSGWRDQQRHAAGHEGSPVRPCTRFGNRQHISSV